VDHRFEAAKQDLPQRGSDNRNVRGPVHDLRLHEGDLLHPLIEYLKAAAGHTRVRDQRVPDRGREAFLERFGAVRVDVDLIPLQPVRVGAPGSFLVHGDAETGLPKTLGETQAADPASDDDDVKSHGSTSLGGGSRRTLSDSDFPETEARPGKRREALYPPAAVPIMDDPGYYRPH
jgi:hypothetical protein